MSLTQNQIELRLQSTPNMCEAEFQHLVMESLGVGFIYPPAPLVPPDPFGLRNPDMTVPYEPLGYLEPRFLSR